MSLSVQTFYELFSLSAFSWFYLLRPFITPSWIHDPVNIPHNLLYILYITSCPSATLSSSHSFHIFHFLYILTLFAIHSNTFVGLVSSSNIHTVQFHAHYLAAMSKNLFDMSVFITAHYVIYCKLL